MIASYPAQDSRDGFSFYNSGSLAGLTVGTTIGSFLASFFGYFKSVFCGTAGISLAVLVMIVKIMKKDTIYPVLESGSEEETSGNLSIFQFLWKRNLPIFFWLYHYPVFAEWIFP